MKNANNFGKLTVGFLLLFVMYSCKKEKLFQPMNKQVAGQWKFEKVTFQKNLSLVPDNITADFNGDVILLKDDKTISYTKGSTAQQYGGNWELRTNYKYVNDQNVVQYLLDLNLDQGESFLGTDVSVTSNKLTFYETKNNGTYTYHFVK